MSDLDNGMDKSAGTSHAQGMNWSRRADVPAFSPAPGVQVQPVIGESMMTCWIALEPGAVVFEHSHSNEQLGVVIEGSVTITVAGETREMAVGDAYVVPPNVVHQGVAGGDGVLLVETFVPIREEYVTAWRAVVDGQQSAT
ncbi:MAG: cupin domain-containing protein [Chloroflexia bacterium]|nr:cupin domain-containing protein [Chloroflexia bacterium]